MKLSVKLGCCLLVFLASVQSALASDQSLASLRNTFLQAERYIAQHRDDDYHALAETLKDYPLFPYLQYEWLSQHLDDEEAIKTFILEQAQSRYAVLLQQKWLQALGQKRQWATFLAYYRPGRDPELQCHEAIARYQIGQSTEAMNKARELWLSGKTLPPACDDLFVLLQNTAQFNANLVWQRFESALKLNHVALASDLQSLMTESDRARAGVWLGIHRNPTQLNVDAKAVIDDPRAGELLALAVTRWLDNEPAAAFAFWRQHQTRFAMSPDTAKETEKRLALALAFRRDPRAYDALSAIDPSDDSVREWRIRAALAQQNWSQVLTAIVALPANDLGQDRWQYWQARALQQTNQSAAATALLQALSQKRSLYGFIAARALGQPVQLNDVPSSITGDAVKGLLARDRELQMVQELLALDRRLEAKRQWQHAISRYDRETLRIAARLAQEWQWPAMAIATIAASGDWDDIALRFPVLYLNEIESYAPQHQLSPAMVLGIIRQESAFDPYAESSASARGLMQLLPETGRLMADLLHDDWAKTGDLFNPANNIRYGIYYFKRLLNQFGNHPMVAIAAYNAGPNRVKRWLPTKALPADIWMETIPYKETRNYVASVLAYALLYQQRLQLQDLRIDELMTDIRPG